MNWDKRLSWGGAGTRKTSRFSSEAVVKRDGRVFYDAFYFDGKRVALHDCVGVALSENDTKVRCGSMQRQLRLTTQHIGAARRCASAALRWRRARLTQTLLPPRQRLSCTITGCGDVTRA